MRMRHAPLFKGCAFFVAAALLVGNLAAQDKDTKKTDTVKKDAAKKETEKKELTPEEQFTQLRTEYILASREYPRKRLAAKTVKERTELLKSEPQKLFAAKFLALAEAHPKDAAALNALMAVMQLQRNDLRVMKQVLGQLSKNHAESKKIGDALYRMSRARGYDPVPLFKAVIANNPHRDAKGLACYSYGKFLLGQNRTGKFSKEKQEIAEGLLERADEEFGDVKFGSRTLSQVAGGELFELRNLQIGMVAPDINGKDVDDVAFKLTDYRGKVVVIDFWGDW